MKNLLFTMLVTVGLLCSFAMNAGSIVTIKKPKKVKVAAEGTWYSFQASSKGDIEVTLRNSGKWNNKEYTNVKIWEKKVDGEYVEVSGGLITTELIFLSQGIIRMKAKGLEAGKGYYISANDRLNNKWKFYFKSVK